MIRHVIMWKFKPDEGESVARFLAGLRGLYRVIPEILHMKIARDVGVEGNFDACLIADFADMAALERYREDPRHKEVSALCKSIRVSRSAVDFEIPDRM